LSFFGLMGEDAREEAVGLPLTGEAGLLVAFPSELVHGVQAVTRGKRYTVVSWFV
jgi:predicted 2-oxoglutarate/Fe(II)-dependent dioxygenase YbiX